MAKAALTHRLAVLIDADIASPQIAPGLFAAVAKLGQASVRRIYGDFSGTRLKGWAEILAAHAIVPQQAFANTPGKNASDIALVIDAMDLLHSGRLDGFCLVSSDSDFTRLAAPIRGHGLHVWGFGEAKTPAPYAGPAGSSSRPSRCSRLRPSPQSGEVSRPSADAETRGAAHAVAGRPVPRRWIC